MVDDKREVLTAVEILMRQRFAEVKLADNPELLPSLLSSFRPDVLLLDMNFRASINTGGEGLFWLSEAHRLSPETAIVLFTAYADVNLAVEGMKRGACDFIVKPFENQHLIDVLTNAYERSAKSNATKEKPLSEMAQPRMFWGTSPLMLQLKDITEKVARTNANILITGDNGTGKELLAHEIHRLSMRASGPMVAVDMGAVTESLFESELFGYVRGAFTDAKTDHAGRMEAAHGGTLFMDEIGNLSYSLQAKLLRSLQQRQIVRVGGTKPIPIDIRLVCATNRDLRKMAEEGSFREDFLYRINTIHLHLPSLAERREDIVVLAQMFVDRFAASYGKNSMKLRPDAAQLLQQMPWKGNIRELEHAVEKAVILTDGSLIGAEAFELSGATATLTEQNAAPISFETLDEMEQKMVRDAIDRCDGNLSVAARQLGITRQTLYNKLKRYGL